LARHGVWLYTGQYTHLSPMISTRCFDKDKRYCWM
jgi:hypothetical protein